MVPPNGSYLSIYIYSEQLNYKARGLRLNLLDLHSLELEENVNILYLWGAVHELPRLVFSHRGIAPFKHNSLTTLYIFD